MSRVLFCLALLGAFQRPLSAAASAAADVPAPAATVAFAESIGLKPAANPAQLVASLARFLYAQSDVKPAQVAAALHPASTGSPPAGGSLLVPIPLSADV